MHLSNESLLVIIFVGIIAGWLAGRVMEGGGFGLIGDLLVGLREPGAGDQHVGAGGAAGVGRGSLPQPRGRRERDRSLRQARQHRPRQRVQGAGRHEHQRAVAEVADQRGSQRVVEVARDLAGHLLHPCLRP